MGLIQELPRYVLAVFFRSRTIIWLFRQWWTNHRPLGRNARSANQVFHSISQRAVASSIHFQKKNTVFGKIKLGIDITHMLIKNFFGFVDLLQQFLLREIPGTFIGHIIPGLLDLLMKLRVHHTSAAEASAALWLILSWPYLTRSCISGVKDMNLFWHHSRYAGSCCRV